MSPSGIGESALSQNRLFSPAHPDVRFAPEAVIRWRRIGGFLAHAKPFIQGIFGLSELAGRKDGLTGKSDTASVKR